MSPVKELQTAVNLLALKDLMCSLAKHIRKLWRFPSDKVILELVILLNINQKVVFTESFHAMVSTD